MTALALFFATFVVFLVVDVIWLFAVMKPVFVREIGPIMREDPDMGAAAAFYLIHVAGIVWFAGWPALAAGGWSAAAINGAVLGAVTYGVYETVNMTTLRGWSWSMVGADMAWGAAVTALAAAAGVLAVGAMGLGRS